MTERILKAALEKQFITYQGIFITLSVDFSTETSQARKEQNDIYIQHAEREREKKNCQQRTLYLANMSFRNKSEVKTFS